MRKNKVTSGDVARHANVSQSAVSRAFTDGASVAPATRDKIIQAAEELGYRPNALAQAMISGRSRLIAVVTSTIDNHFYAACLQGLCHEFQQRGYTNLLFMSEPDDTDEIVRRIRQYQVDGIVMSSVCFSSVQSMECANTGIPVVMFNRYSPSLSASSVISDNHGGGKLAARCLVEAGHEHIAFIAGDENSSTSCDRESGFMDELRRQQVPLAAREVGGYTYEGAVVAARKIFSGGSYPDAVFVANDHMAYAVIDVLRGELGISVPEQVSVIGFDDTALSAGAAYNLTTIAQQVDNMVHSVVETLISQIESNSLQPESIVVPVELTVRGSTRPVGR